LTADSTNPSDARTEMEMVADIFVFNASTTAPSPPARTTSTRGLFVVDASVIPGAVLAHPTLTIMAQALKTMQAAVA
jgi:choline dehydrogenase-like flavoprotein